MGTIRVGRDAKRLYTSGIVENRERVAPSMSDEERSKLIVSIKQMPKEKWVSALRSAGLNDEADECERSLAEEHLAELNQQARANRLEEILSMPEDEQLALLVAEGYEEVAKDLSERLSVNAQNDEQPVDVSADAGLVEHEGVKPRRRGRKSKSDKK